MDKRIRAFYAIPPTDDIRWTLARNIENLQQYTWSEKARWVTPGNIHITLRFLGDITQDKLTVINNHVQDALSCFPAFNIQLGQTRLFPNRIKPRVIAIMIMYNEQLQRLADLMESCALAAGLIPAKYEFKGHITIGRCRSDFPDRIKLALPLRTAVSEMRVNKIALYKSELTPSGPNYTKLNELPMHTSAPLLFDQ